MISIIIPARNEELFIGATLKGLRDGLKKTPYELIVSDGMSTDRTVEIAQEYATVVHETDEQKRCISRGRNLGAAQAKGEYLVFLDADMYILDIDAFFAKLLALFAQNEKLVAVTVSQKVFPEHETWGDRCVFGCVNLLFVLLNNVLHFGGASGAFQMMRASAFKQVGGYREDLAVSEDNDMFQRLAKIGRTRMERSMAAYDSGRRGHIIGWPKLLWIWAINAVWLFLFDKSYSRQWRPIRKQEDA